MNAWYRPDRPRVHRVIAGRRGYSRIEGSHDLQTWSELDDVESDTVDGDLRTVVDGDTDAPRKFHRIRWLLE